ncbi:MULTISPECIES: host attachment protein [Falsihalocynthiibacter]|uniref:host attachment protein n=1 Tax=Falsihalocynthiibacter TaxID=2854182 RepID=UPI0030023497
MKPVVTWAVLANAEIAHVMKNNGPGKGFVSEAGKTWHADPPLEYSDAAGMGHSSHGHANAAKTRRDPAALAQAKFATFIAAQLAHGYRDRSFDRLILVAAPHMLGLLRAALPDTIKETVMGAVDKDLTKVAPKDLSKHLENIIAA